MWAERWSEAFPALCHARGQPAGGAGADWAVTHRAWHGSVFFPTPQTPQLGWHISTGVLEARQLSFQGHNGSVSSCSLEALWEERASSYVFERAMCVNKHMYVFKKYFAQIVFGAYGFEIAQSVLLMTPQVLLGGRRPDLISFYFILEVPWGIQKACENPKTNKERKEKNLQTKKSSFIWILLNTFVNCTALLSGDISSGIS